MYSGLLRRYLAPRWGAVLLMAVLLFGSIGLQLAGPRVVSAFINLGLAGASLSTLMRTALLFMAVSLAAKVVAAMAQYVSERVAWDATNALRIDLVRHLLDLDPAFHTERTPGELIERVDGDVGALAAFFSRMVVQLIGSALLMGGVLISLALVDVTLGLAFAAFAALTVWVLNRLRRRAVPVQTANREQSARVYGLTGELLSATEDVRSSGAVGYALNRYAAQMRQWYPALLRGELSGTFVWVAATVAFACADGIAYLLGGHLFLAGKASLGTLYLTTAYAASLAQPIETLRREMQELQRAGAGVARVQELLQVRSRLPEGEVELPRSGPLSVAFEGVTFAYEATPILHAFDLEIAPGQVLGVAGRTGIGKSTLARLISRQADVTAGRVLVGGVDVRTLRLASLRSRVAVVTQEVQLFHATLRENITLFDETVPDERVAEVLSAIGCDPAWTPDRPIAPDSLSAGEAQLIAFARAFLGDPGLVILDEPSSRLDPATEARLETALSRLLLGRTAIIIAHRPATLRRADRILQMEEVAAG